jgi:hypothetical protein
MPAVVRAPATPSVLERVEEAIGYAVVNGLWLRCSEYGIRATSSLVDVRWERDPMSRGVSPLGAAVLLHQPHRTTAPEAAADALGISLAREEGIADGLALAPKSAAWARGLGREDYRWGWEFGAVLRIAMLGARYTANVIREGN